MRLRLVALFGTMRGSSTRVPLSTYLRTLDVVTFGQDGDVAALLRGDLR